MGISGGVLKGGGQAPMVVGSQLGLESKGKFGRLSNLALNSYPFFGYVFWFM